MEDIKQLKLLANENRKRIIKMIYEAKAGHPGGSLSVIDMLTAIYELDVDLNKKQRSRVILSKGHAVPAQYAVLCSKGIIKDEELGTFRKINSRLQGHPHTLDIPEVDATTGLLGQGLSIAVGMAIVKKHNNENNHVYAVSGDGEMQEGNVWEALMQAPHRNLDNLIAIIDRNRLQIDGSTEDIKPLEDLNAKLKAFNWDVLEIDGHDIKQIYEAIEKAKLNNKPTAILANTIKGKGVSFMENNAGWHGKAPNKEEYEKAMEELSK